MSSIGHIEEGDRCPHCCGRMGYGDVEGCRCHISPPCNACVDNPLICLQCGLSADELVGAP